jgi:hypothetical protein
VFPNFVSATVAAAFDSVRGHQFLAGLSRRLASCPTNFKFPSGGLVRVSPPIFIFVLSNVVYALRAVVTND